MKIKKYTLEQLAKSNPVLSKEEMNAFWGGFIEVGGGYVLLTWDEMVEVFGSIDDMPGYALSHADYEAHSSDPFYSFYNCNTSNGFYIYPLSNSLDEGLSSFINGILEQFFSALFIADISALNSFNPCSLLYFSECSDSHAGFMEKTYLVPISALGSKAEEWGLINNTQGNNSGNNTGITNKEQKINSIVMELAAFMHVSPSYNAFEDFRYLINEAITTKGIEEMENLLYYQNDFAINHFFELYDRNDEQPRQPFFTYRFYI